MPTHRCEFLRERAPHHISDTHLTFGNEAATGASGTPCRPACPRPHGDPRMTKPHKRLGNWRWRPNRHIHALPLGAAEARQPPPPLKDTARMAEAAEGGLYARQKADCLLEDGPFRA